MVDYNKSGNHYDTLYTINGDKRKIGTMSDNQLEISYWILNKKRKLDINELKQLNAIKYIMKYRSLESLCKLQNSNRTNRANKTANIISNWIIKSYK